MNPGIYMLTILVLPVTAVIVFAMRYASSYATARAKVAEEAGARALMAGQADQLSEIRATLQRIADEQSRQTRTLDGVASLLRDVG